MYMLDYRFFPKSGNTEEYYGGVLSSYLAALHQNGQIVGDWNVAETEGAIEFAGIVPAPDALGQEHCDEQGRQSYELLLAESTRAPEHSVVGPAIGLEPVCDCDSPAAYALVTTFLNVEPPVACMDCHGRVPLYRLPRLSEDEGHTRLLLWEETFKAFDRLWIQSWVGERYAWRQISGPKSELTAQGRALCGELSGKTGKPFYYYLPTRHDRLVRKCPSCGADWVHDEEAIYGIQLRCDNCRLISSGPGA